MLTAIVGFILAYILVAIIVGLYDINRLVRVGEALVTQKEIIEKLAAIHGYSPSGWNRFREYQEFTHRNGSIIEMYEEYKRNKWFAIGKSILFSFIIIPVKVNNLLVSQITNKKEKA